MSDLQPSLAVEYRRLDYRGKVQIILKAGQFRHTDKIDILSARSRRIFHEEVIGKCAGIDGDQLIRELDRIAAEVGEECNKNAEDGDSDGGPEKELLVEIATDRDFVELFHTPGRHDAEAFATVSEDGRRETFPVRSKSFEQFLTRRFYTRFGTVPGAQSVRDAIALIIGLALYQGAEYEVHIRVAEHEGEIWIDLGSDEGDAVCVTRTGFEIVLCMSVPVRFVRRRGMKPLPRPVHGGSLKELRPFVNLPRDADWYLFLACMVAYLRPRGPYPILIVNGEQGSAKSTLCKVLRLLIDPNKAPVRRPPKDSRDLMIAAVNSWMVLFDNMSGIPQDLSDSVSSLATGGGFAVRELFTDGEEKLFDATRPVVFNGIEDFASKADLLDRGVGLHLPAIDASKRQDEETLYRNLEVVRPRIFGALLQALSGALRELPNVRLTSMPRMADFARFGVAAEAALGIPKGEFLRAYLANRADVHVLTIEASPIGPMVISLLDDVRVFEGTCAELLKELERRLPDGTTKARDWPKNGRGMRSALTRIAPTLRALGIRITWPEPSAGGNRNRILVLERTDGPAPDPGPDPNQDPPPEGFPWDVEAADDVSGFDEGPEESSRSSRPSQEESGDEDPLWTEDPDADDRDDRDDLPPSSDGASDAPESSCAELLPNDDVGLDAEAATSSRLSPGADLDVCSGEPSDRDGRDDRDDRSPTSENGNEQKCFAGGAESLASGAIDCGRDIELDDGSSQPSRSSPAVAADGPEAAEFDRHARDDRDGRDGVPSLPATRSAAALVVRVNELFDTREVHDA